MKTADKDPGTTPHATTGVHPAELFLKRSSQTRLDLLRPSVQRHVETQQLDQKHFHDSGYVERNFDIVQALLLRNLWEGLKWLPDTVVKKSGPVSIEWRCKAKYGVTTKISY